MSEHDQLTDEELAALPHDVMWNGPASKNGQVVPIQRHDDTGDNTDNDTRQDNPLLAGLKTGDWLNRAEFQPLAWHVPGLIPEGVTMLAGAPKAGKSWMSLDIALAVASGGDALGKIPVGDPRPVLLLALEDGDRRLQARARELLTDAAPIPSRLQYMTRIEPGMVLETIAAWIETLDPDDKPLIILDTLGKAMPRAAFGETQYDRDYRLGSALKRVSDDRPGTALIVVHHTRKSSSDDFLHDASGTHALTGSVDTIIIADRPRNQPHALLKTTGRETPEGEYALTAESGHWSLDGNTLDEAAQRAATMAATQGLDERSAAIIEYVNQHPDGVRAAEVADHLGVTNETATVYLSRLEKSQRISKPDRGLYAPNPTN